MKQNILAKMQMTSKKIILSAVVVVFMLLLTFFARGVINSIERHPAAIAQTV